MINARQEESVDVWSVFTVNVRRNKIHQCFCALGITWNKSNN